LELVHTDIAGPFTTTLTLKGELYFLTFTDDYSGYTIVYLLRTKTETVEKFTEYRSMAEKQTGCQLKKLRSDNGTEYTSNVFRNYCKRGGIIQQFTVPYNPEQNGKSERKNYTLMDAVRSMLLTSGLGKEYWGYALLTANYILNRCPQVGKEKTPYELWWKEEEKLSHIRIWGCEGFAHPEGKENLKIIEEGKESHLIRIWRNHQRICSSGCGH
jgi:transposase InsO family protein